MKKIMTIIAAFLAAIAITITAILASCDGKPADWNEVSDKWGDAVGTVQNNDVSEPVQEPAQ